MQVALLQGNVPQEMKFAPEKLIETLATYDMLIRTQPADLIAAAEDIAGIRAATGMDAPTVIT